MDRVVSNVELAGLVFGFLDLEDVLSCLLVCQSWKRVCEELGSKVKILRVNVAQHDLETCYGCLLSALLGIEFETEFDQVVKVFGGFELTFEESNGTFFGMKDDPHHAISCDPPFEQMKIHLHFGEEELQEGDTVPRCFERIDTENFILKLFGKSYKHSDEIVELKVKLVEWNGPSWVVEAPRQQVVEKYLLTDFQHDRPMATFFVNGSRATIHDKFHTYFEKEVVEGVSKGSCSELICEMNDTIDQFIESQEEKDYHPNSNNVVLDIVHPSMYCFVDGVSKMKGEAYESMRKHFHAIDKNTMAWRKYEDSTFQWLPTWFRIDPFGSVRIEEYINGIGERTPANENLYKMLEKAFEICVPHIASVCCYAFNSMITATEEFQEYWDVWDSVDSFLEQFYENTFDIKLNNQTPSSDSSPFWGVFNTVFRKRKGTNTKFNSAQEVTEEETLKKQEMSRRLNIFRRMCQKDADFPLLPEKQRNGLDLGCGGLYGSKLQVITKIVDYELQPSQEHEGVWHVEGMSHEHILATCVMVLDRDEHISGGDLLFKRLLDAHDVEEMANYGQDRSYNYDEYIDNCHVPLGFWKSEAGSLICFPNCHIHKLKRLVNNGNIVGRRRILVFWIINPLKNIISTREVADQRADGSMTLEQAKRYRLELMIERTLEKQTLNPRELNLCEH